MTINEVESFFVEPGGRLYVNRYSPNGESRVQLLFASSQRLVVEITSRGLYRIQIVDSPESESEKQ